jgi:hypothetical protein
MRRPSQHAILGALAACVSLALPAGASAASPLQEYQQTGHITPCKYGAGQLQGGVPNDVAQYAPDFLSSLQAAARDRARGCGGGGGGGGTDQSGTGLGGGVGGATGGGGTGGAPGPPKALAATRVGPPLRLPSNVSPTSSGVGATPGPVYALAILAALALLGMALALAARFLGWGSGWTAAGGHAAREAGMRVGSAVSGLADWARTRRRAT